MKAMRLFQPAGVHTNPLQLVDEAIPQLAAGQVRLRVKACGVCHTDLHIVEGELVPPSLPITPGHQVVGVVDAVGEGVGNQVKIGDRVGVAWLYSACGSCNFCVRSQENLCPQARYTGCSVDGGFAEMMLADARWLLPIPDSVSSEQAAPWLCAGIIGYRSLRLANLQPGECLGLVGFGASAHLAIQVARYWGCRVFVFTRAREHRRHAEELGAAWTGSIDDTPPETVDRAVIFAPAGELVPKTLEKLRPGGILAINAVYMTDLPSMPYNMIYGERTLRSVTNATHKDGLDFIQLAVAAKIQSTVTAYGLEQANQALVDLKHSWINGEAVLVL
jgi:alcohol dehydrogenase, propanol-preferring